MAESKALELICLSTRQSREGSWEWNAFLQFVDKFQIDHNILSLSLKLESGYPNSLTRTIYATLAIWVVLEDRLPNYNKVWKQAAAKAERYLMRHIKQPQIDEFRSQVQALD